MKFIPLNNSALLFAVALVALSCGVQCFNETEYVNILIERGDLMSARVQQDMAKFRAEQNYFLKSIEDELLVLNNVLSQLREEAKKNLEDISQMFLSQAENQLTIHENTLRELIQMAELNGADPTYKVLVEMVDKLVNRAYTDMGNLVAHSNSVDFSVLILEIKNIESLEKTLKSINYINTPTKAQLTVQQILDHEHKIDLILFDLEQKINSLN